MGIASKAIATMTIAAVIAPESPPLDPDDAPDRHGGPGGCGGPPGGIRSSLQGELIGSSSAVRHRVATANGITIRDYRPLAFISGTST